jgi:phosphoenolpyruvate-protein kinase (PTS system EI component)
MLSIRKPTRLRAKNRLWSAKSYVDFLSFGTNDLTQYAFAADRENAAVEQYFDDASDVIFRLMQATHEDVPDMPPSVCSEPEHIPRLLQCGIKALRRH